MAYRSDNLGFNDTGGLYIYIIGGVSCYNLCYLFIWLCKYSDTPHRLYAGVGGQFQNCNHFKKCIIYRNFCSFYILIMFQQNKMLLYYRLVAKYSANVDLTRQTGT